MIYLLLLIASWKFLSVNGQLDDVANLLDSEDDLIKLNKIDRQQIVEKGPCNIPVITNSITQQEFIQRYAFSSPVIFKNSATKRNKIFQEKCEFHNLIETYGDKYVTVSTANTYSYRTYSMKFSDYLNKYVLVSENSAHQKYGNETMYFFGGNNVTEWKDLFDAYERPSYTLPMHNYAYSFGVAASHTGVPFHIHGPGFAEAVHGRKRWFLYEPDNKPDFNPDKSTMQWVLEEYINLKPSQKPYECILEPLDVIYFPDKWWHATLNIDTAVFISTFLSRT